MPVLRRDWGNMGWVAHGGGDGAPLLVVNGSGSDLSRISPLLERLSSSFSVVSFDHRGFGVSDAGPGPYRIEDVADDAAALISHQWSGAVAVLGISFGGMVAQHLAIRHPSLVSRLVLACTSSGGDGGSSFPLHELADLDVAERVRLLPELMDTRFTPEWLAANGVDASLFGPPSGDEPSKTATGRQFAARREHDAWSGLPSIDCPVLVASGRYDGIAPSDNGRRIAERIPGARFREFDGGHAFFIQDHRAIPDMMGFLTEDGEMG